MSVFLANRVAERAHTRAQIPWFCQLKGNEFFCQVEADFIQDAFNLTGLNAMVGYYDDALDIIMDIEPGMPTCATVQVCANCILLCKLHMLC